jgi:hypothetical protein
MSAKYAIWRFLGSNMIKKQRDRIKKMAEQVEDLNRAWVGSVSGGITKIGWTDQAREASLEARRSHASAAANHRDMATKSSRRMSDASEHLRAATMHDKAVAAYDKANAHFAAGNNAEGHKARDRADKLGNAANRASHALPTHAF